MVECDTHTHTHTHSSRWYIVLVLDEGCPSLANAIVEWQRHGRIIVWDDIPTELFGTLFDAQPRVMEAILENAGGKTKY